MCTVIVNTVILRGKYEFILIAEVIPVHYNLQSTVPIGKNLKIKII